MLHIDGSKHQWFPDDRWHDLIVILDDATTEIYYAQLVEEESTRTVMTGVKEVIETEGLFCALYSDRASHFFVTKKAGEKVEKLRPNETISRFTSSSTRNGKTTSPTTFAGSARCGMGSFLSAWPRRRPERQNTQMP